jgi:hypothetical protein
MNEKMIALLNRQLLEIEKIGSNPATISDWSFGVDAWKSSTISILERIFGRDSRKIKEIEKIQLQNIYQRNGPSRHNIETIKETGKSIFEACIAELEILGIPNQIYNGEKSGFNLTVNQNQENKQEIKLEVIVNELRDKLTGSQLSEIQTILDSEEKSVEKKKKTFEKLKEFGIDTLSNIVAGILTNPSIIG